MQAATAASVLTRRFIGSLPWRFATDIARRGMTRTRRALSPHTSRPQRLERCAHLIREVLRLFPGREMAALGQAAVMQKLRERAFGPTLRRGVDFAGVRAHADGNSDALGIKEARRRRLSVFPI